jgi:hypothetical protein
MPRSIAPDATLNYLLQEKERPDVKEARQLVEELTEAMKLIPPTAVRERERAKSVLGGLRRCIAQGERVQALAAFGLGLADLAREMEDQSTGLSAEERQAMGRG